ncbi:uncharacterized protein LOC142772010 [Rhipicephalus microplus]|uniref:uncharacterized protein LOC142772010 n=1 Tax=Rhipicephalus microplus TaxID=6941 RepID=UPI003F6B4D3F
MQTEVLAAILVLVSTDVTANRDVKQFLNQREPIWTCKTTRRTLIKCEVDEVLSISPLSISLTRHAFFGGSRSELTIFGVLDIEHKERMTVFDRDTFKRTEILLFMAVDQSCAVFEVQSLIFWDMVYYDLRMRDSALHRIQRRLHPACQAYFRRVIGTRRVVSVFNHQCPELLRQGK